MPRLFCFRLWAAAHFERAGKVPTKRKRKKREPKGTRARERRGRKGREKEREKKGVVCTQKNVGQTVVGANAKCEGVTSRTDIYSLTQSQGNKSPVSPPPSKSAADQWRSWCTDRGACAAENPRFAPFFSPWHPFGAVDNVVWRARRVPTNGNKACAPPATHFRRAIRSVRFLLLCRRSTVGHGRGRRKKRGGSPACGSRWHHRTVSCSFFPSLLFSRLLAATTPAALLSRPIRPQRRLSSIPVVRPSPSARAQSLSLSLPFDIAAARRKSRQRKEDEAKGRYGKKHIETEGPREKEEADGIQSALWHLPPSPFFFR